VKKQRQPEPPQSKPKSPELKDNQELLSSAGKGADFLLKKATKKKQYICECGEIGCDIGPMIEVD
jgi:hypothetical protein